MPKLLFDENLSRHLPRIVVTEFPNSAHVRDFALQQADDEVIWELARNNGFIIASKDADFYQRSLVRGAPPKIIWIRVGNVGTREIAELLLRSRLVIETFAVDPSSTFLALAR